MLDAVHKDHDEVRAIQPTWHCLLRFRQRVTLPPGADEATAALRASLERADITHMTPAWIMGRDRHAQTWAIDDQLALAYPLARGRGGEWTAATCLRRER